ncbi:MAG: phage holin family protein [Candidatus Sericytochromatia bacterium]|nr:phage holin family protein [Candidatus Sericytochromatia bacterium]
MTWLIRFMLSAVALLLWSQVLPGVQVDSFVAALLAVVALSVVNTLVKPVLLLLTLPLTVLTLGLFLIVLNVLMIWLAAWLTPGFDINGFIPTLIFGVVMGLSTTVIDKVLSDD